MTNENQKKTLTKKQLISLALAFILLIGLCAVAVNFDKVEETTTETTTEATTETTTEVTTESTTEPTTESTTKKETTTEVSTTKATTSATTTAKTTTTTQKATTTTAKSTTTTKATTQASTTKTTTTQATTAQSTVSAIIQAKRDAGCEICGSKSCASLYAINKWGDPYVDTELCPQYSVKDDCRYYCQTCGKSAGDGTNGTCVQFLIDTNCDLCGKSVSALKCHTCS